MAKKAGAIKPPYMEKYDIFMEGYKIPAASAMEITPTSNDDVFSVFGHDGQINVRIVTGCTVSMDLLSDSSNDVVLCCLTGQDPDAAAVKVFSLLDAIEVDIWRNLKADKNDKYIRCMWIPQWSALASPDNGDPSGRGTRRLEAPAEMPLEFVANGNGALAIIAEKVTLSASGSNFVGSLTDTSPVRVPKCNHVLSELYALGITLVAGSGVNLQMAKIDVTADNVDSGGAVDIGAYDLKNTGIATPEYAYVVHLSDSTGIYPTLAIDGLYD